MNAQCATSGVGTNPMVILGSDRTKERSDQTRPFLAISILLYFLTGCAAGPDFERPAAPDVSRYTATPLSGQTASSPGRLGNAQNFSLGQSASAQWWHSLGSSELNVLIEKAFQANPTLAKAQATLRQAQEVYSARSGTTLYPQVDGGLGALRQRTSPSAQGQSGEAREFSLYNASIDVHYQLDLAGGNRRTLEALAARAEYQWYELESARLTLAANIVTTAITQARLAGQLQSTEAILGAMDEQLRITQERVRLGQAAPYEVMALQTEVEQTRAEIPALRKQLQQNEHLLATLVGQAPGVGCLPTFNLVDFTIPSELPVVLPSELVRRRPDIQAAEALLHAANAEYGAAIAKLYPQINISASLGSQALTTGALFGGGSAVWILAGQLTQPLFNPGLPAEKRAALAAFDAAAANYQYVVLNSLRNAADVLRAVENDSHSLAALASADAAAQGSLESVQNQYKLGATSYVQLLIAQKQAQQTTIYLIGAQAQRLIDSIALYQAMGGGL